MSRINTTWNLKAIARSDEKFQKERKAISDRVARFTSVYKDNLTYLADPNKLLKALDAYEAIYHTLGISGNEGYYFSLKHALNQSDTAITAKLNMVKQFSKKIQNQLLFFELDIAKCDKSLQKKLLASDKLSPYKHFLEKIFATASYNLSDSEERVMNLRNTSARSNWVKMTSTLLSKDVEVTLDESLKKRKMTYIEILPLFSSPTKKVRDSAYTAINAIFDRHIDMAEHEINSILGDIEAVDTLRGVDRPDRLMHLSDDLDTATVDTMIETVQDSFSISRNFYALKAKLTKTPRLAYYERFVPFETTTQKYSFYEALKLVSSAFGSLDNEFKTILDKFAANSQIDVYPTHGKKGGAFCSHNLITQPTYILLNFAGKLDDVLTLAHEAGHGINNEMMRVKQNALHFDTPLACAEIASTFFEGHVLRSIIASLPDDEKKLSLIIKTLDDDVNTILRQVAADLFQRELHKTFREKGYLGKDEIGKIFTSHMSAYMGPAVDQTEGSENWWIYWSHLRVPFYNYQYAFGFLVAKYFLRAQDNDTKTLSAFKAFLSAGSSKSPREMFLKSGIDIQSPLFWEKGLAEIKSTLDEATRLAKSLGKI